MCEVLLLTNYIDKVQFVKEMFFPFYIIICRNVHRIIENTVCCFPGRFLQNDKKLQFQMSEREKTHFCSCLQPARLHQGNDDMKNPRFGSLPQYFFLFSLSVCHRSVSTCSVQEAVNLHKGWRDIYNGSQSEWKIETATHALSHLDKHFEIGPHSHRGTFVHLLNP